MQSLKLMFGRGMELIYGHWPLKTKREKFTKPVHVRSSSDSENVHLKSQNRFAFICYVESS